MNGLEQLKIEVCDANRALVGHGLVTLTWGNVSGITPDRDRIVIKPSGVPYDKLEPSAMVVVDLDGQVVEGRLRPSTDTPTHAVLYRAFTSIGGVTHTHSPYATMFAQARLEIPCLGTTHADLFDGPVPVTRALAPAEVADDYELWSGRVIVERFATVDPVTSPGVLLAGHAPFAWGTSALASLEHAVALEAIARLAHGTLTLGATTPLEAYILAKHHQRKHGDQAYYGQMSPP